MGLIIGNAIDEELLEKLSQDKNGRRVMPIINCFRKLTNDDPYKYCPFELYPIAMMRSLLKFLVEELGLDPSAARRFYINHLAFALPRKTIDEAIDFFGEENFDKIVEELLELADSVNSK